MPTFADKIHAHFDDRARTLGGIKARSLGADILTLTALNVLVYAQLEGGIKDLSGCVLHDLNARRLPLGEIHPDLLRWRNPKDIERLRSVVNFDNMATQFPFSSSLSKRFRVNAINRKAELNQMGWDAIRRVYIGFGLDNISVEKLKGKISDIVSDRNDAAHHGVLPSSLSVTMEGRIRDNVYVVESVLTDFTLQILPFFEKKKHLR